MTGNGLLPRAFGSPSMTMYSCPQAPMPSDAARGGQFHHMP